jgi:hypothetical protein
MNLRRILSWIAALAAMVGMFVFFIACMEGVFFLLNRGQPSLPFLQGKHGVQVQGPYVRRTGTRSMKIPSSIETRPIIQQLPTLETFRPSSEADRSHMFDPPMTYSWPLQATNYSGRAKVTVRGTGEVVYDNQFQTDGEGRRVTVNPNPSRRSHVLAVLGCSFIWGTGVNNEQTLPSQLALNAPSFMVYNYGVPAGSPLEALEILESDSFSKALPKDKNAHGIYAVIADHVRRVRPSVSYIYGDKAARPYYEEGPGDELIRQENFSVNHPWEVRFLQLLANSQTLRYFGLDYPWHYGDSEIRYLAKMLRRLSLDWEHKFHNNNFAVVFWPGLGKQSAPLAAYLDSYGVPYLDYGDISIYKYIKVRATVSDYDSHPSAGAHAFLASQIASDLGIDRK